MKYYLDTEFIEGFHKPLFGKKRHFIDLISIGIVAEDGKEIYLISNDYNYNDADDWVKENVILPLYLETVHGDARNVFDIHNFHKHYGISNKRICAEIMKFIWADTWDEWIGPSDEFFERGIKYGWNTESSIEFYAYFADYDWVVFCSLFGRMINLPFDFPMYCKDLKQMLDDKAKLLTPLTLAANLDIIKKMPLFPKQEKEHTALDDARWNKALHEFILNLN
jgi:hypothetical protein